MATNEGHSIKEIKIMKIFYCLCLLVILLCIGCAKHESEKIENDDNISNTSTSESFINDNEIIELPTSEEYLQEIINNYAESVMPKEIGREYRWEFQIDGNFTGSGNREIIAFYIIYHPVLEGAHIRTAFCFVCDTSGVIIKDIYQINYRTLEFSERIENETGLKENDALGRYIFLRDRIIGRAGDFNGNGIEELYLYSLSGVDLEPNFFEFDGTEFKRILDLNIGKYRYADHSTIIAVDQSEKMITVNSNIGIQLDSGAILKVITNSHIWDTAIQLYKVLSSETKYYRHEWNRALNKYDDYFEIEYVEME